jgi:hypothetical protein
MYYPWNASCCIAEPIVECSELAALVFWCKEGLSREVADVQRFIAGRKSKFGKLD